MPNSPLPCSPKLTPPRRRPGWRPGLERGGRASRSALAGSLGVHLAVLTAVAVSFGATVLGDRPRVSMSAQIAVEELQTDLPAPLPVLQEVERPQEPPVETVAEEPADETVFAPEWDGATRDPLSVHDPLAVNFRLPRRVRPTVERDGTAGSAPPPSAPVASETRPAKRLPLVKPVPHDSNRAPAYPRMARRRDWSGVVVLAIHISADGEVTDVEIAKTSGHDCLDEAARKVALTWRYRPARRGDRPVALVLKQPVHFAPG